MGVTSKDRYWQLVFEDFNKSGVSQRQYCIAKDLSLSKFRYYWKKRQKPKVAPRQSLAEHSSGFAPVLFKESSSIAPESAAAVLSAILPNKIRCEFHINDGSSECLKRILNLLVSL